MEVGFAEVIMALGWTKNLGQWGLALNLGADLVFEIWGYSS